MKYLSGFTFNIDNKSNNVFEFNDLSFQSEIDAINGVGYEYNQIFSNGKIINYSSCVVEYEGKEKDFILEKIEYIKNLYLIEPNEVLSHKDTYHLIFYYSKILNINEHKRVKNILKFIYGTKVIDYHFYDYGDKVFKIYKSKNKKTVARKIFNYYTITQEHNYSFDVEDLKEYIKANNISIDEVIEKLYENNVDVKLKELKKIDIINNVHIIFGKPFEYIYKIYGNLLKTKEFFNNNFETDFDLEEETSIQAINGGTIIQNISGDIFLNERGYAKNTQNDIKQLTDFHIEVNYIINDLDGTKTYIVTLINTIKGIRTPKIRLETKVNAASFSEFVQAYGNYHFYGTTADIKEIHASISSLPGIPEIKELVGFGEHKEEGLILFKNGIWSLDEKMFYDREEDEEYFEGPNNKGYNIVDIQGKTLLGTLDRNIPVFNKEEKIDKNAIYKAFEEMYANNTGMYLLFSFFGIAGHLLFGNKEDTFPILFTRGVTGAGKSKMNSILQQCFGLKNSANDFGNTSVFSMKYALSYLIKMPYFITEYRETSPGRETKVGILRTIFDKNGETKGRADQTIIKYDYYGMPVIDGEEMIVDGALRTRSIQIQLIRKHLISGNFESLIEKNSYIFDNMLYTYFLTSNGDEYKKNIKYFIDFIKKEGWTKDNRIAKNIAQIYAGAMAFDKNLDEELKIVLSETTVFQEKDRLANSTSMQIIKIIIKFLESNPFEGVYVSYDKVVLSWNSIMNFVTKYRIATTLDKESYQEHIEGLGYKIDYVDTKDKMIYGMIIPFSKMEKYFLAHTEIYRVYNEWRIKEERL